MFLFKEIICPKSVNLCYKLYYTVILLLKLSDSMGHYEVHAMNQHAYLTSITINGSHFIRNGPGPGLPEYSIFTIKIQNWLLIDY